jgi:DNA-binding NtrC family response regulator
MTSTKGRILIADDNQTFLDATADWLRREGYEVQTVASAAAAAAELNTTQYDLLIADIQMPGNPELELIRHLPQIAEGLPVLLVTGYPTPESVMMSAELPVVGYMVKPVKLPQLLGQVRRCIVHVSIWRANRAIAQRLATWASDHKSVEQLLSKAAAPGLAPEALVNLTMRNMLGCLRELNAMWQKTSENQVAAAAPADALGEALSAATNAFESTTADFKA